MKNCGRFNCSLQKHLFLVSSEVSRKITDDMLCHLDGLHSHRRQLSTNQRAKIRSVIVKSGM